MQTLSSSRNQPPGQSSSAPGPRPHQCAFCRKRFTKPEHLCRHLRIHTGSKPFECAKCHRRFSRQDTLSRHMRVHTHAAEDGIQQALQLPGFYHDGGTLFEGLDLLASPDVTGASGLELHPSSGCLPAYMDLHGSADPAIPELEFWPDLVVDKPSPTRPAQPLGSHRHSKRADGDDDPSTQESQAVHDVAHSIREMSESLVSDVSSLIADTLYLETCIHMFFARFIPAIPAIHMPTYTATKPAYPLMLTMMAVGSLFVTEDAASIAKGELLWRLVEQRFLTSIIGHAGAHPIDDSIMTVTFLGQCYALLSGKKDLQEAGLTCTATAFQRIRRGDLYHAACRRGHSRSRSRSQSPTLPPAQASSSSSSETSEKEQRWKTWASEEALRRSILGYYIVDGLMADLLGQPTTIHHISNILPVPSADALFHAATADEWLAELQSQETDGGDDDEEVTFEELYEALFAGRELHHGRPLSYLAVRVVLEGLHSCVGESRSRSRSRGGRGAVRGVPPEGELYGVLGRLRRVHILRLEEGEKLEHEIRWHVVCMNLVVELSMLRRQLGRPLREERGCGDCGGGGPVESVNLNLRCALLHATAILLLCQQLPFGRSHCMHIPSALFAAASVYLGVLRCVARGDQEQCLWIPEVVDWDDVRRVVYEASGSDGSSVAGFLTCSMAELVGRMPRRDLSRDVATMQGLLQQLSVHMGISREFGRTITEWVACLR